MGAVCNSQASAKRRRATDRPTPTVSLRQFSAVPSPSKRPPQGGDMVLVTEPATHTKPLGGTVFSASYGQIDPIWA